MRTPRIFTVLCLLLATATSACSAHAHGHRAEASDDIVDVAAAAGDFETLLAAAEAADLAGALGGDGPLTVFAPTDEAFGALPAGTIARLLRPENRAELARVLKFHVVPGRVGSDALADGATLETLARQRLTFAAAEQGFTVEGARIVSTDIDASNGVIHVIDRVMLPPAMMSRAEAGERIDHAIARGVPKFNHGDASGTIGIYAEAARILLADADLRAGERSRLEAGLRAGLHATRARDGAWQLRCALDDVRASLHHDGAMRMTAR